VNEVPAARGSAGGQATDQRRQWRVAMEERLRGRACGDARRGRPAYNYSHTGPILPIVLTVWPLNGEARPCRHAAVRGLTAENRDACRFDCAGNPQRPGDADADP